jgi:dUTP pyrophosphatase
MDKIYVDRNAIGDDNAFECIVEYLNKLADKLTKLEAFMEQPRVLFKRLHPDAQLPQYQTAGAAGMDLVACNDEPITIFDGETRMIPTGLAIELPPGWEAQVRSRSGLAAKGVSVANSPGTVDEDYRGEVKVILRNHGPMFTIKKGDRIAQLVIARTVKAQVVEVATLSATERGAGGFGSTG